MRDLSGDARYTHSKTAGKTTVRADAQMGSRVSAKVHGASNEGVGKYLNLVELSEIGRLQVRVLPCLFRSAMQMA